MTARGRRSDVRGRKGKKRLDSRLRGNDGPSTIAGSVRKAASILGKFISADLVNYDYGRYISKKMIYCTIGDFKKCGEIVTAGDGRLKHVPRPVVRTKLDVIWHLVRSHRQFATDEIERLSGAARATVLEYLHCLDKCGYIRQATRGNWLLISDPGPETPVNTTKCARLKRLRDHGRTQGPPLRDKGD